MANAAAVNAFVASIFVPANAQDGQAITALANALAGRSWNGALQLGLAASLDNSVHSAYTLRCFTEGLNRPAGMADDVYFNTVATVTALRYVMTSSDDTDLQSTQRIQTNVRDLYICAAFNLVRAGFFRIREETTDENGDAEPMVMDCDHVREQNANIVNTATPVHRAALQTALNAQHPDWPRWTLFIAVVTKIMYWLQNHHTGTDMKLGGILQKVIAQCSLLANIDDQTIIRLCHWIGHHSSTCMILTRMQCSGVLDRTVNYYGIPVTCTITPDLMLRAASCPSGTHMGVLAKEGGIKFLGSGASAVLSEEKVQQIAAQVRAFRAIERAGNLVKYHPGTAYLTYNTVAHENLPAALHATLADVGCYLTVCAKFSTLAKSPRFANKGLEALDGFDEDFRKLLVQYQEAENAAQGNLREAINRLKMHDVDDVVARAAATARIYQELMGN